MTGDRAFTVVTWVVTVATLVGLGAAVNHEYGADPISHLGSITSTHQDTKGGVR